MEARHVGSITDLFGVIGLLDGAQNECKLIRLALYKSEVPGRVLCGKEFTYSIWQGDLSLICVVIINLLADLGNTDNEQEDE